MGVRRWVCSWHIPAEFQWHGCGAAGDVNDIQVSSWVAGYIEAAWSVFLQC
jgi:hypothetical protein